ncbi:MAG: hypothetical protein ACK2US_06405 [Anaerolineae bacterium]|jgi:hypothetical protein
MRKKLLFALATALIATLIVAAPAFAWTSVYGQCIDSATLQGWAYGGTVTVYGDVTAGPIASGSLAGDGTFNISLPPEPLPDNTLYIVIIYNAGPLGAPGTFIETIPDIPTGTGYNLGYIKTDTGPNAVTLADASAQSPSQWLLAALAAVALVGVGGAVLLFRRRRVA